MIENSQPKPQVLHPSAPPTNRISLVTKPRKILRGVMLSLALITIYSLVTLNTANLAISDALHSLGLNLNAMFLHPSIGQDTWSQLLRALLTSVSLAMLTTLLGALIAFFIALGAARNLAPSWLATSIKAVMAFIRAIPTILWVLIYSVVWVLAPALRWLGSRSTVSLTWSRLTLKVLRKLQQIPSKPSRPAGLASGQSFFRQSCLQLFRHCSAGRLSGLKSTLQMPSQLVLRLGLMISATSSSWRAVSTSTSMRLV